MQPFNKNSAQPVRVAELKNIDTSCPLLMIKYEDVSKDASAPADYCSLAFDNNGAHSAADLLVTLRVGTANAGRTALSAAASTTYDFSHAGAVVTSGATAVQVSTLGDLVDALNAIDGITAYRLHGNADLSLNTNDFVDMTETQIGAVFQNVLYRDASEYLIFERRIGIPEPMDHGMIELVEIVASVDSASATDCVFEILTDPDEGVTTNMETLPFTRYVPDTTITQLYDFRQAPQVVQGPILVRITCTSSIAATTAYVRVAYRNGSW
jgi:hypothetical protein